ncbi:tRNA threonylcarbamoyladenosine dehydratase [Comamonas faecalis]|uniref:tRNA threonylcarbamoyladenosine dehydratase n=1 Tax=Comamonas faecalis TaxID=1387849 RepID=A0ABP7R254_9BURK
MDAGAETSILPEVAEDDGVQASLERRFGGLARLYGVAGAARIRTAHAVVIGIGGVGSWAAEALARSGVGRLTLIDLDHVAESNVNRQIHALTGTLGQAKVQAMAERIAQINPDCQVQCIEDFVDEANWPALLQGQTVDAVIDACDQVRAKTALAAWALRQRRRSCAFVSVGAAGGKRLAHKVDLADLSQTTHDPLLAQLRYRLRREHGAPQGGKRIGIACIFSREAVAAPHASCDLQGGDGSLNCRGYGSSVAVTATFGQCAAGWVMENLAVSAETAIF